AFLTEDNALITAKNPDSSSYNNNLDVWVEEWKNNSKWRYWVLDTTTIYNKESGTFYYPKQALYKFYAPDLDEDAEYRLIIINKITGKIISSQTKLIHSFSIIRPYSSQNVTFASVSAVPIRWNSAYNGKLYQIVIRFKYKETNLITNHDTIKSLDWNLGSYKSKDISGTDVLETNYYGQSFYKYLQDNIPVSPDVVRNITGLPLEFIFSVAADDFNKYLEINAPSTGVLQYKPEYTNVNNGIGIFSSRFQIIQLHNMNSTSIDSLMNGTFTKDLNFR
ncbi:MAG: hypothetical protein HGB12_12990, partial [Bacteroidetes bacterium]|nr:hypothetical protein [Bacteroidota bacterium]